MRFLSDASCRVQHPARLHRRPSNLRRSPGLQCLSRCSRMTGTPLHRRAGGHGRSISKGASERSPFRAQDAPHSARSTPPILQPVPDCARPPSRSLETEGRGDDEGHCSDLACNASSDTSPTRFGMQGFLAWSWSLGSAVLPRGLLYVGSE
ncbi:hypothetical protein PHLGIDRAFT_340357 [Phlebiopsis gigantea 11061_1 CR5-6]|uniref:Uncharacterized protein n=1 Tax=Phlebiopsis gigantea (strain 11061_1 CR5-6) TaxID=745531 RepID=A0A0C3SAL8_PHLG1|nr:hypothetical protein PHLGIDRAFT_340357 [Phlebiopsis gigantea 11061_1 CR5-6]